MNPSQALAVVLLDELLRGDVSEAVLCPGSRNAPLSYALLQAERAGRLRLHVRVDERTAGFLALGLARQSGAPVVVCCTSGTAVANLHPALVEADLSDVPVVAVTADRPAHLRRTGANQTIDQVGIFGTAARWHSDVPAPGAPGTGTGAVISIGRNDNSVWRSLTCRALDAARGTRSAHPGPVHLNLGFAEPLTPNPDRPQPDHLPPDLVGRPDGGPWTASVGAPVSLSADTGTQHRGQRTLVVLGDRADPELADLAAGAGYPVVAEPSAWLPAAGAVLSTGSLLLGCPELLAAAPPDRVIVSGRATLGRELRTLLSRSAVETVVVSAAGDWPDPDHVAAVVVAAPGALHLPPVDGDWAAAWSRADTAATKARDSMSADGLQGAALARLVRDAAVTSVTSVTSVVSNGFAGSMAGNEGQDPLPGLLVCASSMAIRDLDRVGPVNGLSVLANRGAAGIDGTLSTAVGAALAYQRNAAADRAFALVGDLAFLHDLTGLVIGPDEPRPDLTIVVADDDGGAIFATLEYGEPRLADSFRRVFATPHGTDIPAVCAGLGIRCTRAATRNEVSDALADSTPGIHVVHVRTDRTGRRSREAELRVRVRDAVAAALRSPGPPGPE